MTELISTKTAHAMEILFIKIFYFYNVSEEKKGAAGHMKS